MNDANAKCPYCGKPLAGKSVGATQTGQNPPADSPAPAPQPAPQAGARSAGGAKTILWGVGAPLPGVSPRSPLEAPVSRPISDAASRPFGPASPTAAPKPVEPAPRIASEPSARAAAPGATNGFSTAATVTRNVADPAQGGASSPQDGSTFDVDVSDAAEPQPARPGAKPPATVMFDESSSMAEMLRSASAGAEPSRADEDNQPAAEESGSRPVKSKGKGKLVGKKGQRGSPGLAKWGSMGAEAEDDVGQSPASSSKKGIVIAAIGAAIVLVAVVAILALRGGKSTEESSIAPPTKSAEPVPAKAEPAENAEPPALAAKPAAEPMKPVAPAKPVVAEKPAAPAKTEHEEKVAAERGGHAEKPAHAEKAGHEEKAPAEKGKPAAAESGAAPAATKPAAGSPTEINYERANEAYQRGNAKLFQGNTADAISDFNRALQLNPKDPAIHRGLGLAYAQSGNSAEAVKHLKAYLKAAPKANDRAIIEKRIDQLRSR